MLTSLYSHPAEKKELDLAFAAAGASRANGASHADNDEEEDDDDDEYEDDEGLFGSEQLFDTPLDKLDSYALFSQVIQGELPCMEIGQKSRRGATWRSADAITPV